MRAALLLLLAACTGGAPARSSARARPEARPDVPVEIGVASGLEKLRPADPVPQDREIALSAARGECESAQIAVRGARPIAALSAEAPPLAGPGALPVTLYRVATLSLPRGSGPEGEPGEWPDPLVPVRDPFFGEPRRAFPVEVGARRLQAIWVEVCVPGGAPAGEYRGEVRLRDGARALAAVPLRLRVWPFTLPATGAFTAAFGLPTRVGTRALGKPDDPELARALAAALQRHRISPYTLSADPPDGDCTARRCALDWSRFDAELGPVLDGTLVPGVKGTFAEVRIPAKVWDGPEADLAATLRAWKRHFDARGWSDRLWLYTLDEPRPEQFPELRRRARLAREAGIRVFATIVPDPALAGAVDAFAPNLTLAPDRARRGDHVSFSYASCMSHGCDEIPASGPGRATMLRDFRGWPGYAIDRPGTAARAVAWLGWRRGLAGELYYDVLHAWVDRDPWKDVRAFAGNGDGTLLYPGLPRELGGEHGFPVESIRLKIIRDALEDLELLRLAEAAGLGELAQATATKLVPSARGFERDPHRWLAARAALGDALARRELRAKR
ncbi:DUF4091 domain-containing protein [Anaeromyxobacter terrae]|uniref:DUF4091 domain-containing protein n=1 Tax=Anaeromyxobacter terrae TaxID=2925406 RepID=UPI001F598812|nr:DUF4091 domain-containing protein [Anaeromyxobacter sp. SG22]